MSSNGPARSSDQLSAEEEPSGPKHLLTDGTTYKRRRQRSISTSASSSEWKTSRSSSSSRSRVLNDSTYPFSHGLPGVMYAVLAPTAVIQPRTVLATNSGPPSERMWAG